jgi:hypothetical protein
MIHLLLFLSAVEQLPRKTRLAIHQALIGKLRFYSQRGRSRQAKLGVSRISVKMLLFSRARRGPIRFLYLSFAYTTRRSSLKALVMSRFMKWYILSTVALLSPALSQAEELTSETRYRVAIGGLPIARADFKTEVKDRHFSIEGDINSAGLAALMTTISAQANVSGQVGNNRLEVARYTLYYKRGRKSHVYDVVYHDGNVTSTKTTPEPRRPDNWIPVTESDLRSVLDPISGLIFPATANICAQTLPIYDGETRMDLKLSPRGSRPFTTDGFKGNTVVCGVRFTPKSGYKKNRDDFEYLRNSDDMEIWFAKSDSMNIYAPVYVRIPTKYGTVTITAVKYGS